jgi:hypothetical protein
VTEEPVMDPNKALILVSHFTSHCPFDIPQEEALPKFMREVYQMVQDGKEPIDMALSFIQERRWVSFYWPFERYCWQTFWKEVTINIVFHSGPVQSLERLISINQLTMGRLLLL